MRVLFFALFAVPVVACVEVDNPPVEEVINRASPVVCEKAKECNGDKFGVAYPGGMDSCVEQVKSETRKKLGDDTSKISKCTEDEVNECLAKLKSSQCPAQTGSTLVLPPVPCDC
jgi:hypothetical protein